MHKTLVTMAVSAGLFLSVSASARDIGVEIANLTNGTYFTPLLVAAHGTDTHLFRLGTPATASLQAMAEGGDVSGLAMDVDDSGGIQVADPAGGLLAPGASVTTDLSVRGPNATHLSIVAMLLPSNDGFVGLDSLRIPNKPGSYTYFLNGYDAGTEANDEIVNGAGAPGVPGVPADPGGHAGAGATGAAGPDQNPNVHIHRSVLGDTDPAGGISDLDSTVHRWLNPVARVVVTVGGGAAH